MPCFSTAVWQVAHSVVRSHTLPRSVEVLNPSGKRTDHWMIECKDSQPAIASRSQGQGRSGTGVLKNWFFGEVYVAPSPWGNCAFIEHVQFLLPALDRLVAGSKLEARCEADNDKRQLLLRILRTNYGTCGKCFQRGYLPKTNSGDDGISEADYQPAENLWKAFGCNLTWETITICS